MRTLVTPQTLAQHLDDPSWVLFDCRHALTDGSAGKRAYDEGHIPGAFFADADRDLAGERTGRNGRHPLPDPETFVAFLQACGVSDDTQIVAYDEGSDIFAARLWFLARLSGHDAVAVLDGGLAAWREERLPLSRELPAPRRRGNAHLSLRSESIVDSDFVADQLGNPAVRVVDARSTDRFAGLNETIDPVAGHIPGAYNVPFKENFDAASRFKNPEDLRRLYEPLGDPHAIVHQCGSGISACANMLAMEIAGLRGSRLYPGSWSEWITDPTRPISTGAR